MLDLTVVDEALRALDAVADRLPHSVQALFVRCIMAATEDGYGYSTCLALRRGEPRLLLEDVSRMMSLLAECGLVTLYRPAQGKEILRDAFYRRTMPASEVAKLVELKASSPKPAKGFVWKVN